MFTIIGFPRVIWLSLASERQSVASDQAAASGSVVDVAIYLSLEAR